MQIKTFILGDFIFRELETGQEAFIIDSGEVEMTTTIDNFGMEEQKTISTLKRGEMFGEMALIDNGLRMATARAKSKAVVLKVISQSQFNGLLKDINPFVKKMLIMEINRMRSKKP